MVQQRTSVMVIGATGNIGKPIIEALQASGNFEISALTRSTLTSASSQSVRVIKTDYSHESLLSAFQGQDIVLSTIATSNLPDQQKIIDAAVEAGVKRFVPSEFGGDTSNRECLKYAPCFMLKTSVIDYLRSKESSMEWTSFITGMWFDWSLIMPTFPYWNLDSHTFTMYDDGETPFEAATLAQVGKAVAAALSPANIKSTKNQYVFVHSFTLTLNEVLAALEATTGQKWNVEEDQVVAKGDRGREVFFKKVQSGKPMEELTQSEEFILAIYDMIVAHMFGEGGVNQFGEKARLWGQRLGVEDENLQEVVKGVVAGYSK